jgi:fructose-specific component phosphotransferase system IIB-like protein
MRSMLAISLVALIGLTSTACDSKSEAKPAESSPAKKDAKSGDAKAGEAKADAPAAASKLDLAKIGLKADAPAGATVGDGVMGTGVMVMGDNLVVGVEEASASAPKTIDEAKSEAEMYGPKNIKEEKLADGWLLTFENEGSMGKNYHVNARREIGGKAYSCTTMQSSPEQSANAVAFCKSLSK